MEFMTIKQESEKSDPGIQCSIGQANENTFESLYNLDNPDNGNAVFKHDKFYGKQFRVHVHDSDMVFNIEIISKYDNLTENDKCKEWLIINQHQAACLLEYTGFNRSDIVEALNLVSTGSHYGINNDFDQSFNAEVIHENYTQTSNNQYSRIRHNVTSVDGTEDHSESTFSVKSEFNVDMDESTDEYSDDDFALNFTAPPEIGGRGHNNNSKTKHDQHSLPSKDDHDTREAKDKRVKRLKTCQECGYTTTHTGHLKRHIRYKHTNERAYHCYICDIGFIEIKDLRTHMSKIHNGKFSFKCSKCDYTCDRTRTLKHHKITEHKGKPLFACSQCDHKSASDDLLKKHVTYKHPSDHRCFCPECNFSCRDEGELEKHRLKKHTEHIYNCQECNYVCSKLSILKKHMRKHTRPFMCHVCSFRTSTGGILRDHITNMHTQERRFQCQECPYKTTRSSKLKNHIMLVHRKERNIICPICGVPQYGHLKRHIASKHTGDLPFKCDQCDFRCNRACNLKQHILCIHIGEKPFRCHICTFACNRSDGLNKHLRKHCNI